MRRIATTGTALLFALALQAGCGHHYRTHQFGTGGTQAALQPPTRVQGALDPDLRLADNEEPYAGSTADRGKLPASTVLRGTVDDSYHDSLSPME